MCVSVSVCMVHKQFSRCLNISITMNNGTITSYRRPWKTMRSLLNRSVPVTHSLHFNCLHTSSEWDRENIMRCVYCRLCVCVCVHFESRCYYSLLTELYSLNILFYIIAIIQANQPRVPGLFLSRHQHLTLSLSFTGWFVHSLSISS